MKTFKAAGFPVAFSIPAIETIFVNYAIDPRPTESRALYGTLRTFAPVFAAAAVVFRVALEPNDGETAGGHRLKAFRDGIVISSLYQLGCYASASDFLRHYCVADIEAAVLYMVGHMCLKTVYNSVESTFFRFMNYYHDIRFIRLCVWGGRSAFSCLPACLLLPPAFYGKRPCVFSMQYALPFLRPLSVPDTLRISFPDNCLPLLCFCAISVQM